MQKNITIPVALQIRVDDVAWRHGADERFKSRSSRSGLPRDHHPMDYEILHRLGKALDMKIGCSLVMGEWDRYNRLRGVPHVTYDEENWDMASEIDPEYARQCLEILEGSEYIDYTLHGLIHGYHDKGKLVTERQYYPFRYDPEQDCYTKEYSRLSPGEFRQHIDLFLQICADWGLKKPIRTFASPCGCMGTPESNRDYIRILKDYGIQFWHNGWSQFDDNVGVCDGVICAKGFEVVTWDAYDVDPNYLPLGLTGEEEKPRTDFCFHWTNFIRFHPENNFQRLDAWADYFHRQAEVFGVMLSKSTPFAASQAVYNRFAKMEIVDNCCTIDLTEVDSKNALGLKNEFYISFRKGFVPKTIEGAELSLHETKQDLLPIS